MENNILDTIRLAYPEFSEEKTKLLLLRTLSWLAVLSKTTVERIDDAKQKNTDDVEERAIVVALSIIARVVSVKYANEAETFNKLVSQLMRVDVGAE